MPLAKTTKDHDEIRQWAEARGGKPGVVAATETEQATGILRLMFPNAPHHNDDALEEISWDEFFEKFDESGLELIYQEQTADGQQSDFNKLVYPDPESEDGKALLRKTASKKRAATKSTGSKSAGTKTAGKTAAKKSPAKKTPAKKTAAKQAVKKSAGKTPAKKAVAKKSAGKKAATKSASKSARPSTPARNYPKPDPDAPTQVF